MEVAAKGKVKRRHLNAEECDKLGQSSEGANALTQPQTTTSRQGKQNHNRGLYPRTPTKRRKCAASASGSPAGKQRGISDFYSVTGVLSSSPQKSPQPSTSTCTNGLHGEHLPKGDAKVVKEDEGDDDDDDDDDVSLLATVMATDAEAMEDEMDDASLLAAERLLEPVAKKEHPVDYLEGITAEMFGDDEEFSRLDGEGYDNEEVEALPDVHFGLLGNTKILQQPQGCIEDLPEEVLRQVLCLLSAKDLFRNVSLVCHRWRNIVLDTRFVPYKKKYCCYTMREKSTEQEIFNILRTSHILDPKLSQHSLRHLVVLMAQHKVGERVRPEEVLECVKKHRLYPQAEASITLRIPDVQKSYNQGIEDLNPYAAMAVILLLSESVSDVQTLVSLLSDCMSHTAISEYLYHMAMMLLALMRCNAQISNRLHYNIYYVLHLMETFSSSQSGPPQITREQQEILSHDIQPDHVVKIVAFAGTGKTTTLVKFAEQRPHLRFLYVAFNKSVATEAQRRFPKNVECKTVHALAFKDVGKSYHYRKKLTFNLKPFTINSVLPEGRGGFVKAKVVTTTLNTFMASADPTISIRHVPSHRTSRKAIKKEVNEAEKPYFVHDAQTIWNKMKDLNETTKKDAYQMTHDGYLKLWQLQVPQPQLSDQYDVIFIDEAQDCTPAIMDVLLSQRCGKILVGDPHQQIYTFKGAVNALQIVNHTHIFYLTQSFRFGAEIAYVGATLLKVCKKVKKILVGGNQKGGVCDEAAEKIHASLNTGVPVCPGQTAILSRCNVSVFSEAVRLTDSNPQCRVHFIGGVSGIGLDRILDIWKLMEGQHGTTTYIKDGFIRCFSKRERNGFEALKTYAEQAEDRELEAKLSIVEKYRHRIPELARRLDSCYEEDFHRADFIVGTVHKAKGLEFENVIVSDDFVKMPCSRHNLRYNPGFCISDFPDDEWNLLYVAVTRARSSLIITNNVRRILTMAGEYFLKSDMPGPLQKAGEPLPCCVTDCPNCTRPGSAFIMFKREMKCSDGLSPSGPLCERCVWSRIGPTAFLQTDDVLSMAEIPRRFRQPIHHMMLMALF